MDNKEIAVLVQSLVQAQMREYDANFDRRVLEAVKQELDARRISKIRLIGGTSNPGLVERIANHMGLKPTQTILSKFNDGQLQVQIKDNVRGCHCVVIQTSIDNERFTQNDHFMQACTLVRACKLADAKSVSVVYPFFPYARSDKKDDGRVAIGSKLCVDMMREAGATSYIAVDLHAGQIQGFTNDPFDNLYGMNVLIGHLRTTLFKDIAEDELKRRFVIVSPDQGGAKRARAWGQKLSQDTAVMDKHRNYSQPGTVLDSDLIGNVAGMECILVDDMLDTGGTMMAACRELKEKGATRVHIVVTHGVFSCKKTGDKIIDPIGLINESPYIDTVIVTNTIPQDERMSRCKKLHVVDVAPLLGEAILRHRDGRSISELFA